MRSIPLSALLLAVTALAACSDDGAGRGGTTPDTVPDTAADAEQDGDTEPDVAEEADVADPDAADDGASDGEPSNTDPADAPPDIGLDSADVGELGDPLDWGLAEPGPFTVGYRRIEWTYQAPWHDEPRTVPVDLWYPATDTAGETPSYHRGLFPDRDAYEGATLAPSVYGDTYPVHLHSHGSEGFGGTSAFLMRHFASHGWVCVAPNHVGNLLGADEQPRPAETYLNRPRDLTEALNAVEALPEDDPLAGLADTSNVVLSGHSFGVYTVWAAIGADFHDATIRRRCASAELSALGCADDEVAGMLAGLGDRRIKAAIGLAGSVRRSFFGPLGHRAVTVPFLSMSGSEDPVGADAQFETTSGVDLTWVELGGGCHQSFALGGCPTLANPIAFEIVRVYALAFARAHVLGDDGAAVTALLDGSAVHEPDVVTWRHHPADPGLDEERWGAPPEFASGEQVVDDTLEGVRIVHRTTDDPRPLSYWVVLVDPTAEGIDFTVTAANGDDPRETTLQPTRHFVDEVGATVGVNAHFFSPWPPEDSFAEVIGLSASDGDVYSGFDADYDVGVAFTPERTPVFVEEGSGEGIVTVPDVEIDDAVGAREAILRDGVNTATWEELHPRTGIGVTGDGRLVLMVVDGRQDGVSEGMTTPEMADVMAAFGVMDAINLDGGGSSTLVLASPQGALLNEPVGVGLPGSERPVGSSLGIYAEARRFGFSE